MPEQPEVERAVRRLREVIVGRRITRLSVLHDAQRRQLSERSATLLLGRRVDRVERRGKHQLLYLDDGAVLHVHFRMAGDWWFGRDSDPAPRHERVRLVLDDGAVASLVDPRALAGIARLEPGAALPQLGPEVTDVVVTPAWLRSALASRRGPIKPVLLDQRLVSGIGNIYAAEALWHARIRPTTPAARLGPVRLGRLIDGLRTALALGDAGATRYAERDGELRLAVYDREGQPCRRCATPIRRIVQAGRSTYYCPHCQR